MARSALLCVLLSALLLSCGAKHISIVLFGATGDLAKKYLWQSFFEIYRRETAANNSFSIFAVARAAYDDGATDLLNILSERVKCPPEHTTEDCETSRTDFIGNATYVQVKTDEQFQSLGQELNATGLLKGVREAGRLFYLSIPPSSYAAVVDGLHQNCRLPEGEGWTRVVLEKPFGSDYDSALDLVQRLSEFLREEEIYRIDHYLGKESVSQIVPFRVLNRKLLEPIWNKEHILRVEVVMKEELDAAGRTAFYDQYGVIRDVMQNHLTEMLALVAMDLPANPNDVEQFEAAKLAVLEKLRPVSNDSIVAGQYKTYNDHLLKEDPKRNAGPSSTATFAATALHIDNRRWFGVPFIMTAGKALDERVGYIRVIFRAESMTVSMTSMAHEVHPAAHTPTQQVVFYIGHGPLRTPAILCTKNLVRPEVPAHWHVATTVPNTHLLGVRMEDYHILTPDKDINAYLRLIDCVYQGERSLFVSSQSLLLSWKAWDAALKNPPKPLHYDPRDEALLQFEYAEGTFRVATDGKVTAGPQLSKFAQAESPEATQPMDVLLQIRDFLFGWIHEDRAGRYNRPAPTTFRGSALVSGSQDSIIQQLADSILEAALQVVYQEKRAFHLALSGGTSPVRLLRLLAAQQQASGFPWTSTHLWMVDERCVPLWDDRSNFQAIAEMLLPFVHLPYLHIHPMPGVRCNEEAAAEYAADLLRLVPNGVLDFVVLGVGEDGHTASLFPGEPSLKVADKWVTVSNAPADTPVASRITLTYPAINSAKTVAVLITGVAKRKVVAKLADPKRQYTPDLFPISGVKPVEGRLIWFIDHAAL
eukprot:EG_transcript_2747